MLYELLVWGVVGGAYRLLHVLVQTLHLIMQFSALLVHWLANITRSSELGGIWVGQLCLSSRSTSGKLK